VVEKSNRYGADSRPMRLGLRHPTWVVRPTSSRRNWP